MIVFFLTDGKLVDNTEELIMYNYTSSYSTNYYTGDEGSYLNNPTLMIFNRLKNHIEMLSAYQSNIQYVKCNF